MALLHSRARGLDMNRQEFKEAVKLARNPEFRAIGYLDNEMQVFSGCALDSKRRYATIEQVASLIVAHCQTFAGTWLNDELQEIEKLSKRFDLI